MCGFKAGKAKQKTSRLLVLKAGFQFDYCFQFKETIDGNDDALLNRQTKKFNIFWSGCFDAGRLKTCAQSMTQFLGRTDIKKGVFDRQSAYQTV
ncbi:MAG: hypothetical protein BWY75_00257 [bacterium ADurb.Bin425]|nr:MAG: hypothetical protein BWY75_00257 [bacterium ADurb.Bin425]